MSDSVGRVAAISVYPVKSLGGRTVPAAQVDTAGLRGDRAWSRRRRRHR